MGETFDVSPSARRVPSIQGVRASALAVDIALVSGIALVLGLIRLGTPSLWLDESFTADGSPVQAFTGGYHWLYYSLEWPWRHLVGSSELDLRLPSVLGSMLACAVLVALGRRLFDRSTALVAGILLATSPFFVKWSQQARGYTLLTALGIGATLLLLRALERRTRSGWAVYGVALSAVILWHPVGGLLLLSAHAVLIAQRREEAFPHALLAGVVVMAIGVPWAAQIALRSTGDGVAMNWLTFPSADVAARTLLDVSGIAGVGLVLAMAGLWMLHRRAQVDLAVWLGAWAFVPFALALLVSLVRPIYLDRYLIVAAPAFALLSAVALVRSRSVVRVLAVTAVVLATSIGLVRWYAVSTNGDNWQGENWRAAVTTVRREQNGAAIVVAPWSTSPAATYYGAEVSSDSTARSIWVLEWTGAGAPPMDRAARLGIGLEGHRLVERMRFGPHLQAELWKKS